MDKKDAVGGGIRWSDAGTGTMKIGYRGGGGDAWTSDGLIWGAALG